MKDEKGADSVSLRYLIIFAVCFIGLPILSRADDRSPAVRIIATADYTEVHPDGVFDVTLSLKNLTNATLKIQVPEGDWDRLWRSSNRHVTWDAWTVDGDEETPVEIPPHQTYTFPKALEMYVDDTVKESHVEFKMGFKAKSFGKTLWSDSITLEVIP